MEPYWWSRRPAARLALLFVLGIIVASAARVYPLPVLIAVIAECAMITGLRLFSLWSSTVATVLFHVLVILLGWFSATVRIIQLESDILNPKFFGERVIVDGRIESDPVRKGTRAEMVVVAEKIVREIGAQRVRRRLLVHVAKSARWINSDSLRTGDAVRIACTLEPMPGARNPGEFDYGRYLALNGIQGYVVMRDSNAIELRRRADGLTLPAIIGSAQHSIYSVFDRYHSPEESAYLKGVVFGYRADLSAEVKESFMNTGTTHILAVSGSNVVVIAMIFSSLIGFLRVSRVIAAMLTVVGLLWYMVITGLSPSVIRATIMGIAILAGGLFGKKGDIYNSLGVAALVMLLWDPLYLFDVGFQLSFAAVISIVFYYPKLEPMMTLLPDKLVSIGFLKSGVQLFMVSLAAQIGTLPFTVFYFGKLSLVAVVANLIVVPVSGVNVLLGFATVAFSAISDGIAACYAALDDLIVRLLLKFVLWCSRVPFAFVETPNVGGFFTAFYYIVTTATFGLRRPRLLTKLLICSLLLLNVMVYRDVFAGSEPRLTVTVIDVGQGDSILLELPDHHTLLIDTGPKMMANDSGERIIAPLLKRKGVRTIDAMILTHPHDDHIGGSLFLLEHFCIRQLIVPDTTAPSRPYKDLLRKANEIGVPVEIGRAGQALQFDPTTRIFVLSAAPSQRPRDLNDVSIVLGLRYGRASMLLMGDASIRVEERMLVNGSSLLKADVLKVGHHGAVTSSGETFLSKVKPELALISVGTGNKFRHPSPAVLARLESHGITIARTDRSGALVLQSDGNRFMQEQWRTSDLISLF